MKDNTLEPTVSEHLAAWGRKLDPAGLPGSTRTTMRNILVDIVGLCVAARGTDYVAATLEAIDPGGHTVIGQETKASAAGAALVNGTAAHGEDFDDTFEGGPVHSGVVIVPALLAAAETYRLPSDR